LQVKKEMLGEIEAAKQEAEMQISTQRNEYEQKIRACTVAIETCC